MTKAKPFRAEPVPDLTGKGPDDTLRRAQVVSLIAHGKCKTHKDVSSKLSYDSDPEHPKIWQVSAGLYTLNAVAKYTELEYPGDFPDIPRHPRQGVGRASGTSTALGVGYALPATLEEREREIHRLLSHVRVLEGERDAERRRADEFEEKARKRDSVNASKGRRGLRTATK